MNHDTGLRTISLHRIASGHCYCARYEHLGCYIEEARIGLRVLERGPDHPGVVTKSERVAGQDLEG